MSEPAGDGIIVQILADIRGLLTGTKESAESVEVMATEIEGSLEALEATVVALLGPFAALFALVEGVEMFGGAIHSTVELAQQLQVLHEKTGITVEDLSRLRYAANLSEVSSESLTMGLQRMARAAENAAKGGANPAAEAFKTLGVAAADGSNRLRPMSDILLDMAEKFKDMPDGTTKAALAMDIFGRSGADLIPFLNRGRDGIKELEKEADRLGATMTEKDVKAALEYEEAMKKLHAVWDAFVRNIVLATLPVLEKLVQTMTALVHVVTAVYFALLAAGAYVGGNFTLGAYNALQAWEALKKVVDDFTARTPAQTEGKGTEPPVTPKNTGPSALELLREEWNKIKEAQIGGENDLLVMEIFFWKKKLDTAKAGSKEYLEIHAHIVELETELGKRSEAEQKKITKDIEDDWKKVFDAIPKAFENTVKDLQRTGGTFRDFMVGVSRDIVAAFAAGELKMLEAHAAAWLAKKGITAQGVLEKVAVESWGALKVIGIYAAEAAAAAWSAIAGIPVVGPFLAPLAAGAALAGVLALAGGIKSAAGGYDIPSGLNPMAQLHSEEMVLPKDLANTIRGMARGGSSGGGTVIIQALDAADVHSWAMRNKGVIYDAAMSAANGGRAVSTAPGRRA
jgi:hypothetical protein